MDRLGISSYASPVPATTIPTSDYYCLVGNIPKSFHASDLRNYFAAFVEDEKFKCFHFRHRPQVITINNIKMVLGGTEDSCVKEVTCCLVQFSSELIRQSFVTKYKGLHWMDKEGNGLQGRCVIQQVTMSNDELKRFSKELSPPNLMPKGNVGTCTQYFIDLIKQCRLPPSLIKKLGLEFPLGRRYKEYSKVPFDYGTNIENGDFYEEEVVTRRGHVIPDVYVPAPTFQDDRRERIRDNEDDNSSDEDNDRCEDWERHEALHEDVTSQERLKERLYEEEIEVVWEKGGPGIVWHTDAQYWQAQEGGFDEQTSDDWDVDMEGYYVPGGGDKDARDCLDIRRSERFREGIEDISIFRKKASPDATTETAEPSRISPDRRNGIGKFEIYTKGFGRKVMERFGWKDGQGLGRRREGIKDALFNDGQGPMDKRGIGYYGEKLSFGSGTFKLRGEHRKNNRENYTRVRHNNGEFQHGRIGTIFDRPSNLDKNEPLLRSNDNTFVRRYSKLKS